MSGDFLERGICRISVHRTARIVTVTVSGDLDLLVSAPLRELVSGLGDASTERVVVDLAALDFIDIAGLRALQQARHAVTGRGIAVTLRHPPAHLSWLVNLLGVTDLLLDAR
ncbi:STAS domain-containing protein [Actinoplanes teichomyceticus]|uniref:Anti-anti-sigma factor n=1 Tax=Actinoplanes teichomyceticus TaxID=1867 RepID=A0A561VCQ3_ACTTI|nr:STAS domain-containing protein [Actinoplanes teichomyceticus]TWG09383.1 anti-anti-sigma factor [Actinoplanes teichomyceticus]GIF17034.1 hypothetical protein Ate01nite_70660 [Actinoplanes teichomyceticus]